MTALLSKGLDCYIKKLVYVGISFIFPANRTPVKFQQPIRLQGESNGREKPEVSHQTPMSLLEKG